MGDARSYRRSKVRVVRGLACPAKCGFRERRGFAITRPAAVVGISLRGLALVLAIVPPVQAHDNPTQLGMADELCRSQRLQGPVHKLH